MRNLFLMQIILIKCPLQIIPWKKIEALSKKSDRRIKANKNVKKIEFKSGPKVFVHHYQLIKKYLSNRKHTELIVQQMELQL